jgi:hypothetical protein
MKKKNLKNIFVIRTDTNLLAVVGVHENVSVAADENLVPVRLTSQPVNKTLVLLQL